MCYLVFRNAYINLSYFLNLLVSHSLDFGMKTSLATFVEKAMRLKWFLFYFLSIFSPAIEIVTVFSL